MPHKNWKLLRFTICITATRTRRRRTFSPCWGDRKSTRLNSSHLVISYAVFCLKKKKASLCSPLWLRAPHQSRFYGLIVVPTLWVFCTTRRREQRSCLHTKQGPCIYMWSDRSRC